MKKDTPQTWSNFPPHPVPMPKRLFAFRSAPPSNTQIRPKCHQLALWRGKSMGQGVRPLRMAVGGWWLAVGGPGGVSLRAVLNKKKKIWVLEDTPGGLCEAGSGREGGPPVLAQGVHLLLQVLHALQVHLQQRLVLAQVDDLLLDALDGLELDLQPRLFGLQTMCGGPVLGSPGPPTGRRPPMDRAGHATQSAVLL